MAAQAAGTQKATGIDGWSGPLDAKIAWASPLTAGVRESWWPMFSWGTPVVGNPEHNHWAVGGPLEKFDRLVGANTQAWQMDNRYRSTSDGLQTALKIGDRWDSFNAGHCNQDAMRSAFFEEPTRAVTRDVSNGGWRQSRMYAAGAIPVVGALAFGADRVLGAIPGVRSLARESSVEFTPQDIRGLMVLCMDDLVDPNKGNGGFDFVGYRFIGAAQTENTAAQNHDDQEPYPHDVIEKVCKEWGQNKRLGIVVERKPGQLLDNCLYDAGRVEHLRRPPAGFNPSRVPPDGQVKFFSIQMDRTREPDKAIRNACWVHTAPDGKVTSGWIHAPNRGLVKNLAHDAAARVGVVAKDYSPNPDFFWIAHLKDGVTEGAPWVGFAEKTNPRLDMFEVWTLFMESTGKDWKEVARQHPERLQAHMDAMKEKHPDRPVRDLFRELGIRKP